MSDYELHSSIPKKIHLAWDNEIRSVIHIVSLISIIFFFLELINPNFQVSDLKISEIMLFTLFLSFIAGLGIGLRYLLNFLSFVVDIGITF